MIPFFKNLKECAKIVKNVKVQDFLCNYTMMSQQIFCDFKLFGATSDSSSATLALKPTKNYFC